ncbi:hypothetical protein F4561_001223 [Lipingzhangella halophila]|uniref:Uncharacterized protein n=1 Tax=Lipingzhangella halophila TaxID=1783352 RepID=A0A7W7W1K2_9ACTN|nr:hypothetical protein [Lipingzhangella halophila]MBB4930403.1 hypothetical protein [Lipingzhangella halophila]
MAVLLTSVACVISGFASGWVFASSYSVWSVRGVINRQQRELIRLREEVAALQQRLYEPPDATGTRLQGTAKGSST